MTNKKYFELVEETGFEVQKQKLYIRYYYYMFYNHIFKNNHFLENGVSAAKVTLKSV